LADKLDGLPLALATAGAYLHQVTTSFADYLRLYEQSWLRLQQKTPQLLSYENRALYSTWNISLDQVKQRSDFAEKLLQLWGYFDNQDVWFELLQECPRGSLEWFSELTEDQISFDEAVRVLSDYALVEADATSRTDSFESQGYSMHSCVHSWTKHVVNEKWNNELANLAISCVSSHVLDQSRPEYWVTDQRLAGHSDRCLTFIRRTLMEKDDNTPTPEAVRDLAVYCSRQGRLGEAEELYGLGMGRCENAVEPRMFEIEILNNLGNMFLHSDRLGEAEEKYRQALHESEKTFGQRHWLSLRTVNHLGACLVAGGQLHEAEVMLKRALEGRENFYGPDHLATVETAHNLGELYFKQDRYDEAEDMLLRALEGRERKLGADHILTLETVGNLSNLYRRQKESGKAKKVLYRALKGFEQAFGPDHTSTLHAANHLGLFYIEHHEPVQAKEMFSRALKGDEQAFGTNLTLRLEMINNLGSLYVDQGELDNGEKMYRRALEGREQALGLDHLQTLNTLRCLGMLYANQNKLDESMEMYKRVLEGFEKRCGSDHPHCHGF
jgi:tetratricopeptide (TPR) repeat protein